MRHQDDEKSIKIHGQAKSPVFKYLIAVLIVLCFQYTRLDRLIPDFNALLTIFLSILLEALPFILIGTLISSVIDIFVSVDFLRKVIPKNRIGGLLIAAFCGMIFPICECAIVPVAGRLVKKEVPVYVAVTFLLSVPIVNPVVLLSTYYAFNGNIKFVLLRFLGGLCIALLTGFMISFFFRDKKNVLKTGAATSGSHHGEGCSCGHDHCEMAPTRRKTIKEKIIFALQHTTDEFFDVAKFFVIGAFLSALFQTYLPRSIIGGIGENPLISIVIMMILAYILSVCSESDAFIARTFLGQFSPGAVIGFMVFGPMIDIKNTLMLRHHFKRKFIILLIVIISVLNLLFAILANMIL